MKTFVTFTSKSLALEYLDKKIAFAKVNLACCEQAVENKIKRFYDEVEKSNSDSWWASIFQQQVYYVGGDIRKYCGKRLEDTSFESPVTEMIRDSSKRLLMDYQHLRAKIEEQQGEFSCTFEI